MAGNSLLDRELYVLEPEEFADPTQAEPMLGREWFCEHRKLHEFH
jgi:hypothetical protein